MSTYVGIDQSYSGFGITLYEPGTPHTTEVWKFETAKYGTGAARLLAIESRLYDALVDIQKIGHVVMEGYAPGSKFGREVAGELGGAVKTTLLREYGVYPTIVSPTGLKKFVLGAGKGHKNEMLLGCYKRWGVEFKNDNAADSYACARLAHILERPEEIQFQYEQDVVNALTLHTERFTA